MTGASSGSARSSPNDSPSAGPTSCSSHVGATGSGRARRTPVERHGTRSTVIVADLARPGAADDVWAALDGATPDTLVNAARVRDPRRVRERGPDRIRDEITVNVTALVDLTRAALPAMLADAAARS